MSKNNYIVIIYRHGEIKLLLSWYRVFIQALLQLSSSPFWQPLYHYHCNIHNASHYCLIRLSRLNGDFWRFIRCCRKNLTGESVVTSTGIVLLLLFCTLISCVLRQDSSASRVCSSESNPGSVKLTRALLLTRSLFLSFTGLCEELAGCCRAVLLFVTSR